MNCPDCGVKLSNPIKCPCGWKKKKEADRPIYFCSYDRRGYKCQLNGTIGHEPKYYCSWHHHCLENGVDAYNLTAFREFRERSIKDHEGTFLHHVGSNTIWHKSLEYLWREMTGTKPE